MKYLRKNRWHFTLGQRIGLFLVLIVLLIFEFLIHFNQTSETFTLNSVDRTYYEKLEKDLEQTLQLIQENPSKFTFKKSTFSISQDSIKPFNPNDLPQQGWEKLGFTPKQAAVIMKYKQILGGTFESKEQIRKCFVISDEVYAWLAPKILLPEKSKTDYKIAKEQTKKSVQYKRFNPNAYTEKDWMKIGFTVKQAQVILKYKGILGGAFTTKEQLQKCFVISDEKYLEMAPYIDLPESSNKVDKKEEEINYASIEAPKLISQKIDIKEKFNPNLLDKEGWMKLGFTEKQAQTILNFKKSLGGSFKDAFTLSKSYVISEEKFKELEPYLSFD